MTFSNPVIPGFYPDPSICRVGEDYYLVTSSFEYFPGVPVFHSRDLVNWEQIGHCLTRREQVELDDERYSRGIWAPTIRYHDGRFYMTTTNMSVGRKNFIVHTDDPAGEWSDPIWVDQGGIDPSLFFEDGKIYYITSGNLLSEINIETGEILDGPRVVWEGAGGRFFEGPHIYKRDGWYYLMEAEGGLMAHLETIGRSRDIWGPYESCPHNPILSHVDLAQSPIQNAGHADLCEAHDGSWWIVFLATRPTGLFFAADHLGRETFMAPVEWNEDGWPVVNKTGSVELEMNADLVAWNPLPPTDVRDDFDSSGLQLCWNYIRNPITENYSLIERPGFLRLRGSEKTLSDSGPVTFVGRRQQHFDCRASVRLDFEPTREGDEAGLTALMCFDYHYDVAVVFKDGAKKVIVRRTMKSMRGVVAEEEVAVGPVVLEIRAMADSYALGYCIPDGSFRKLAGGESRFLTAMVAETFTGVYLGMYATGNGSVAQVPADFDWFDYQIERKSDGSVL